MFTDTGAPPGADLVPLANYGIDDYEAQLDQSKITYKALLIARAKSGELELRLLSEQYDGLHMRYMLQTSTNYPFTRENKPLIRKGKEVKSETVAKKLFEQAIAKCFPPSPMASGSKVATHDQIL